MRYLLSFAAGAMLYVVVEELIPEMSEGEHSNIGVIFFAVGAFCAVQRTWERLATDSVRFHRTDRMTLFHGALDMSLHRI